MKFFTSALLVVAIEASKPSHYYGGHHGGAKIISKLVPETHLVKEKVLKEIIVPKISYKTVAEKKHAIALEHYSNDSGDHYDSNEHSQHSVDGSLHQHNDSDSSSDSDHCYCLGLGYESDSCCDSSSSHDKHHKWGKHHSSSSSDDCKWGKCSDSHSSHSDKEVLPPRGPKYHLDSDYVSNASDHTHYHDGSDTYQHSHEDLHSISSDSSSDEHLVEKTYIDYKQVPVKGYEKKVVVDIIEKPVTVLKRKDILVKPKKPYYGPKLHHKKSHHKKHLLY